MTLTFYDRSGDAKYAHLAEADIQKVVDATKIALSWLENARQRLAHAPKHLPPPHTIHQIRQERQVNTTLYPGYRGISASSWIRACL